MLDSTFREIKAMQSAVGSAASSAATNPYIRFLPGAHANLLIAASLLAAGIAVAQAEPVKTDHTQVELLAEQSAIQPGQPFTLGLSLTPDPGWHTYWINPGDAGKPASLRWDAPEGLEFGELQFPAPGFVPFMSMMSYGYNEPTLLLVDVIQSQPAAPGVVAINARASWLVCDDKLCVPERANLSIELPVASEGSPSGGVEAWKEAAFAEARALQPQAVDWQAEFYESGGEVVFDVSTPLPLADAASLYLFPEAVSMIDHTAAQQVGLWPDRVRVSVPAGSRIGRYDETGMVVSVAMDGAPTQSFRLRAQRAGEPGDAPVQAPAALSVTPGGGSHGGTGAATFTSADSGSAAAGGGASSKQQRKRRRALAGDSVCDSWRADP